MIYFISDLHLSPQAPRVTQRLFDFLDFLGQRAQSKAAKEGGASLLPHLYILGDLFEVWLGDDCLDDPADDFSREIVAALQRLTQRGVKLSFLHGNRDFLLGEAFAQRCSAKLLKDPYTLSLPSWQFVLSHGDALCTDDAPYQNFRREVRSPLWQASFLAKPLPERRAIAQGLRRQSENAKQEKSATSYLMDLNPGATDDFIRQHGYATFIHGHTHRPATHDHWVDGIHVERWVMADWQDERGEYLVWDGQTLRREILS